MPVEKAGSKKVQLGKDKTMIFVLVSIAAVIVVAALMISKGLWTQASYLGKVADKKEAAVKQLEANKEAVSSLSDAYEDFISQNPNLLLGDPKGQGERDGANDALILDALPSKYDFPAVTSSVEKLLTGYSINGIEGTDDSLNQQASVTAGATEIPFEVEIQTNYDGFKNLITAFNKSIRPFQISKLELSGTNAQLTINLTAKTYYQPELGLQVTEEIVP